ncbi:MAG: M20/M25/M40 family metallo-hydrolase [bacterium]|nr:M20/M25/M40 family metallo-hydrolase [bacterium]
MNPLETLKNTLSVHHDALIALARRLIQTPSVNGVDDEAAIAHQIAAWGSTHGLHTEMIGADARRPNVIVTVGNGDPGLLLIGHLDTVTVGDPARWTLPPFAGEIANGRLYGRGAFDTKGGIAAACCALLALHETGLLRGAVQLIGVPDEESGATGTLGITWLHEHGRLRGKGAIYCYGGHEIILGHRGLFRCRVTCHGEAAHTGFPAWQEGRAGANAVTGMARLLVALESIPTPYSTAPYFERFRTMITPGTRIEGGAGVSIVPETCTAVIDVRLTPETTAAQVKSWIGNAITRITAENPKLRFEIAPISVLPPAISDERAPIFAAVEAALIQVTGEMPQRSVAGPANEGYLLIERGIPTVCGFGPLGGGAHSHDEYVELDSLRDAALMYALTALALDRDHA